MSELFDIQYYNHILPIGPRALKRAPINSYLNDGLKFALGPMGRAIIALTFKEVDLVLSTQKVITKHQKKHQKFHHNKHLPSSICHYTTTFFREINFTKKIFVIKLIS